MTGSNSRSPARGRNGVETPDTTIKGSDTTTSILTGIHACLYSGIAIKKQWHNSTKDTTVTSGPTGTPATVPATSGPTGRGA